MWILFLFYFVLDNFDDDLLEVKAYERFGEVLFVFKGVFNKYQFLYSIDIFVLVGTLISKVKSYNYEDISKVFDEFYEFIDQFVLVFSSR